MKIIKNGNFPPWLRFLLRVTGIAIAVTSYELLPDIPMLIGVVVGMVTLAVGTYAERANLVGLRPFDNSRRKAIKGYGVWGGE